MKGGLRPHRLMIAGAARVHAGSDSCRASLSFRAKFHIAEDYADSKKTDKNKIRAPRFQGRFAS